MTDKYDVAFILALREEDKSSDFFSDIKWTPKNYDSYLEIYAGETQTNKKELVSLVKLIIDDQGPEIAGIKTTQYMNLISAKLLILVGISGRISDDCRLCDVVIAKSTDNPMYRTKIKEGKLISGGKELQIDGISNQIYRQIQSSAPFYSINGLDTKDIEVLNQKDLLTEKIDTHFGPIAMTPYLVDDPEFQSWIIESRNRHILAVDMESYSVVLAAIHSRMDSDKIVVVRGISDLADGSKKEHDLVKGGAIRKIALNNATQLIRHVVSTLIDFKEDTVCIRMNVESEGDTDNTFSAFHKSIEFLNDLSKKIDTGYSIEKVFLGIQPRLRRDRQLNRQIEELSKVAYKVVIDKSLSENKDILGRLPESAVDYLVAYRIMEYLFYKDFDSHMEMLLSRIYPHRINKFCKKMLFSHEDERKLVSTLIRAYSNKLSKNEGSDFGVKAHICYLMGRVRTGQQKIVAKNELVRWREQLLGRKSKNKNSTLEQDFHKLNSPEKKLLFRSICISLIVLEAEGELESYIEACLYSKEFDNLNRGFHLEYYGDIEYDPRETMNNVDCVGVPIDRTFNTLIDKISRSIESQITYPLRDVELITLLSLCQKRLAAGCLESKYRAKISKFLSGTKISNVTESFELRDYCEMLKGHFEDESFSIKNLIYKFYSLKKLDRSGWNDVAKNHSRKTEKPESVLSHTAGGLLLIEMFLPEKVSPNDVSSSWKGSCSRYSKETIRKIFLFHDLAESYIGDLLPRQRNDEAKAAEAKVNKMLGMLSTYNEFQYSNLYDLWEQFENKSTINGAIAREIDRIDCFIQLCIEHDYGSEISDYESWKTEIEKSIINPVCQSIVNAVAAKNTI